MEKIGEILKNIKKIQKEKQEIEEVFTNEQKKYIKNLRLYNKNLYVYLKSSAQVYQFNFYKKSIKDKLNQKNKQVKNVIFKVG